VTAICGCAVVAGVIASPTLRSGAEAVASAAGSGVTAVASVVRGALDRGAEDTSAPAPPMDVVATIVAGRVLLHWQASPERDVAYVVYRSSTPGHAYQRVSPLLRRPLFTDGDLRPDAAYQYVVKATDRSGNASAFSEPALLDASGSLGAGRDLVSAGDAELPVEQEWGGLSCVSLDRIRRVADPRAQGTHAYEVTVQDGDTPTTDDERCELTQGNGERLPGTTVPDGRRQFGEGNERWIGFQVRVGEDWDADTALFNNFMQLKNHGSGGPPLKMSIDNGRIKLGAIDRPDKSAANSVTLWSTPFTPALRNRWLRFLLHVRFSPDADEGFVALYGDLDGGGGTVVLMPRAHVPTMKVDDDGEVIGSHPRIGVYRDSRVSGTARIWFDGFTVARTREAAEAVAFTPRR
jgi:hypothetical protein